MTRAWRRILEFGGLGVVVFVVGVIVGGGLVFGLHKQHWLGDKEVRKPAAFSEVPKQEAGELAARFRPWLKFDSKEAWRPLNVSRLLNERAGGGPAHMFCTRHPPSKPVCDPIGDQNEFDAKARGARTLGSATYLDLAGNHLSDYRGPARCDGLADCGLGPGSAIYYHVTASNDRFYIDYWWFLRFNHFYRSQPNVSCGLKVARENGVCDEHEGDWEGVTIVTPPDDADRLDYVVYAAHKGTFRYPAATLGHHGNRPDVYVARGSHAAYPKPCAKRCYQPIAAQGLVTLPESSSDGGSPWERNRERCGADLPGSCLQSLPRTDSGLRAWTDWPGQWGAGCGDACGRKPGAASPRSPGLQSRYQTPSCSSQAGVFTCDGRALGCGDWLGPLVVAVACDPDRLSRGLRANKAKDKGSLSLTVKGEKRTAETTPGIVQTLGDPLTPGETATVAGGGPQTEVLVRARQGALLVEARFSALGLRNGQNAVITVARGTDGPTVLLGGRTPAERRTAEIQQPGDGSGQ